MSPCRDFGDMFLKINLLLNVVSVRKWMSVIVTRSRWSVFYVIRYHVGPHVCIYIKQTDMIVGVFFIRRLLFLLISRVFPDFSLTKRSSSFDQRWLRKGLQSDVVPSSDVDNKIFNLMLVLVTIYA